MSSSLSPDFFSGLVFYFSNYGDCAMDTSVEPQSTCEPSIAPGSPQKACSLAPQTAHVQASIRSVIQTHSGTILDTFDAAKATHYICPWIDENRHHRGAFIIATLYWLRDAILARNMHLSLAQSPLYSPRKAIHPAASGLSGSLVSISGYHSQRATLVAMLLQLGAVYTDYLSERHGMLICERMALARKMATANKEWLEDSYAACKAMDPKQSRYQVQADSIEGETERENGRPCRRSASAEPDQRAELQSKSETFEKRSPLSQRAPAAPSHLAKNTKGFKKSGLAAKQQATLSREPASAKRPKTETPKATDDATKVAAGATMPVICLTGFRLPEPETKRLEELGSRQSEKLEECTHLIAPKIQRTEKFLKAIPLGLAILSPEWIADALAAKAFPAGEDQYLLADTAMESKYRFTLKESMARAKRTKLFKGRAFYLAESTTPPRSVLAGMILAAGGHVLPAASPVKRLTAAIDEAAKSATTPLILIDDAKGSLRRALPPDWLASAQARIESVEYVLTGILTQTIQE